MNNPKGEASDMNIDSEQTQKLFVTPVSGREKTWDECGIEEKVERLRRAVRDLRWDVHDASRRAFQFEDHKHDAIGTVVVPLRARYGEDKSVGRDSLA